MHPSTHPPPSAVGRSPPRQVSHRIHSCHNRRRARWHLAAVYLSRKCLVAIKFQVGPICCVCVSTHPPPHPQPF